MQTAVEKGLREIVKGRDFAKLVQLDAAKTGGVSIHKTALLSVMSERDRADLAKVFGIDAPGYVAFDKDAVFFTIGPDALERIKTAIAAKPGPVPLLDVAGNLKRLHALITATGGERNRRIVRQNHGDRRQAPQHVPRRGCGRREADREGNTQHPWPSPRGRGNGEHGETGRSTPAEIGRERCRDEAHEPGAFPGLDAVPCP